MYPPPTERDVPPIPIGLDAYRFWDRLPYLRIGTRAYMRSTYDRAGGNEMADASHFIRQEAEDMNVTLDVAGPGVLYFVRTNHWHGSPWHYVFDGADRIVQESSTADPEHPVAGSTFIPPELFPVPLAYTWSITKGADLNWVPMPFERSFKLAYGRTFYGTGYYIYHLFPEGAGNLLTPLRTWDHVTPPGEDVTALIARAGEDIGPVGAGVTTHEGAIDVPAGATVRVLDLAGPPAVVRVLRLTVPRDRAVAFARARLRVTWDGRAEPSVDAPVGLFFGTGSLHNRTGREHLVRGLLAGVRFRGDTVELSGYFPMPFHRSAVFEIVGGEEDTSGVAWQVRTIPYSDPSTWVGYFHATYRDHPTPARGQDLVILDTTAAEGGGSWCGSFVGMSWIFSHRAELWTLEGDPRMFFDDSASPQGYGTGTEEWGGGGDYWGGQTMTLPLAGHPVGAPSRDQAQNAEDQIQSAYRMLVADLMPFGRNARIQLEHGGNNESPEHYESVAWWYGAPDACLVRTDSLHVSDPDDEAAHRYVSLAAGPVETLTTRYELGVDHLDGVETFPATTDTGRRMNGTSEFTLRVLPENKGVLLRRKLDYGIPDQRAEVFVAEDRDGATFERAGVWYLAGSNTCVFSYPPGELGPAEHVVQTSNRRWREDELLLPRRLTEGRSAIRVRIVFTPVARPLYPGAPPPPPPAWSEYRYTAYSYVLPSVRP